ncbi:TonB-dependent receptor [Alteromonas sp. 5E99-2]|uniref:TonB-dependent receptor n=1 Tax=Alteromonas sp. 5E99-2 TaxID=2817683 RepID=UPI001A985E47|nr:TonB-dependent receptor [Alteromonas sp. 5E99-2]MBO1254832.1 TonB-dependent receptor [Alteromonas sp. 5E99-2]
MLKTTKTRYTKTLIASCVTAILASSQTVYAQEVSEEEVEKINITGFRSTLIKGRDLKRDAVGTRDSIVAEDIADFPDLNLAEALQRIPGVAITRDGGEGRRIAIRGMDSNFALVQLNGMDVLGNTDTAQDSRSQGSRDRAFDFNLFASELFNQIDVTKSYSAEQDEGGLSGNVSLRTAKPFDYSGFNGALSGQLGYNDKVDGVAPRVAFLASNTWDKFGALVSIAYSKRESIEEGVNTFRWRQRADDNGDASIYGPQVSAEDEAAIRAGEVLAPRASRLSQWGNEQTRLGITSALQYKADSFDLTLDLLYGQLDNERDEYHVNPRGNEGSMAYGAGVTTNNVIIEDGVLLFGEFLNTNINVESRDHQVDTDFTQIALTGNWDLSENLSLHALVGKETSDLEVNSLKVYVERRGDFTFDYTDDILSPEISYGQDLTDASEYWLEEIDIAESYNSTENTTFKLDLHYLVNDTDTLKAGVSYKELDNATVRVDIRDILNNVDNGAEYAQALDDNFFFTVSDNEQVSWAVVDAQAVLNSDFVQNNPNRTQETSIDLGIGDSTNGVTEETTNLYVQYEWDRMIADMPFRGNLGARYYQTDTSTEFLINDEVDTFGRDYDGILPALNLVLETGADHLVRFSVSENLTRPSYNDLAGTPTVSAEGESLEVNGANPELEPYTSLNWDLGFEWYFDEVGYLAIGLFRKDLDGYIIDVNQNSTFGETGVSLDLLPAGFTANSPTLVSFSTNSGEAFIQGAEFSLQSDFHFLPAPFDKLGMVGNVSFTDGEVENFVNGEVVDTRDFPNLSDVTGSLTTYYETEKWGVRLSFNYRSKYINGGAVGNDQDFSGFEASTFWDLSAFYQLTESLKLTLEGSNLTDQADQQFSRKDNVDRLYNVTNSGRIIYLGASYQF